MLNGCCRKGFERANVRSSYFIRGQLPLGPAMDRVSQRERTLHTPSRLLRRHGNDNIQGAAIKEACINKTIYLIGLY